MRDVTLEELLEAGCHFGHQVNRRNPKADVFIFEPRSNVHIINLEKTREGLLEAAKYVRDLSSKGGSIVVVGTKRQARGIVKEEVERARESGAKNIFYVTSRWVGGILTNFEEVSKNFKKLDDLNKFVENRQKEYTKREISLFEKEKNKLAGLYEGIASMDRIPDALFVIDTHLETTAIREALIKDAKTVGIVDTNADPEPIDYPIPANDDAVGSIKFIINYITDAWIEGQKEAQNQELKNEKLEVREEKVEKNKKTEEKVKEKKTSGKPKEKKSKPKADRLLDEKVNAKI